MSKRKNRVAGRNGTRRATPLFGITSRSARRREALAERRTLSYRLFRRITDDATPVSQKKKHTPSRRSQFHASAAPVTSVAQEKKHTPSFMSRLFSRFRFGERKSVEHHQSQPQISSSRRNYLKVASIAALFTLGFSACKHNENTSRVQTVSATQQSKDSATVANDSVKNDRSVTPSAKQTTQSAKNDTIVFTPFDPSNPLHMFCEKTFANIGGWNGVNIALSNEFMEKLKEKHPDATRDKYLNNLRYYLSRPTDEIVKSVGYELALAVKSYLNNCDPNAKMPEDAYKILDVQQSKVPGGPEIQVIAADPCGDGVEIKRIHSNQQQVEAQHVVQTADSTMEVVNPIAINPADSVYFSDEISINKREVKDDNLALTKVNGTEYSDRQATGKEGEVVSVEDVIGMTPKSSPVDVAIKNNVTDGSSDYQANDFSDILGLKPANKKVIIENQASAQGAQTDSIDLTSSVVLANTGDFKNFTNMADSIGNSATVGDNTETAFNAGIDLGLTENRDSINNQVTSTEAFNPDSITITPSSPIKETKIVGDSGVNNVSSVTYKIVPDSDEVEKGTAGLGNNPSVRGGVNGSGTNVDQQNISKDTFGKNYELLVSAINNRDEWRTKGSIFEGITGEQAVFSLDACLSYYPNDIDLKMLIDYAIGCHEGEVLPSDVASRCKKKIDLARQNHTLEGKPYDRPTQVISLDYIGCDDPIHPTIKKGAPGNSIGGGEPFAKYFVVPTVTPPERAFVDTSSTNIVYTTETNLSLNEFRGTEYSDRQAKGKEGKVASVDDILNTMPKGTKVELATFDNSEVVIDANSPLAKYVGTHYNNGVVSGKPTGSASIKDVQDTSAEKAKVTLALNKHKER